MRMNVEEARNDQLAARIEDVGVASPGDVGLDSGDAASRDGDVANRVKPDRGVDDTAAPDDQIVFRSLRRERSRSVEERRRGDVAKKLAPVEHRSPRFPSAQMLDTSGHQCQ